MKCKNCDKELCGQENFCSNCGQKNIASLNLKYILGSFIDDFFNVDSKLFRTLKYLTLKPGFLSQEYMEGKRVQYLPPIRLYIVLSVIFFFLISIIPLSNQDTEDAPPTTKGETQIAQDSIESGINFNIGDVKLDVPTNELKKMEHEGTLNHYLDSVTKGAGTIESYFTRKSVMTRVKGESFNDTLLNQVSLFLLLFMPFLALLYATIFSGSKKGFVGHLIFNLHLNSFVIFSVSIYMIFNFFVENEILNYLMISFFILFGQVYLIRAIMLFYNRKWWIALYKYFILVFGYSILAIVFMTIVVLSSVIML